MKQFAFATLSVTLLFSSGANAADAVRGFERVTTCEVKAYVYNSSNPSLVVDEVSILKGGFAYDTGGDRCKNLGLRKAQRLCKINNKKGLVTERYQLVWGFKIAQIDLNPPFPECAGPTDPRCFDTVLTPFKLETVAADFKDLTCSELLSATLPDEEAASTVVEADIEQ